MGGGPPKPAIFGNKFLAAPTVPQRIAIYNRFSSYIGMGQTPFCPPEEIKVAFAPPPASSKSASVPNPPGKVCYMGPPIQWLRPKIYNGLLKTSQITTFLSKRTQNIKNGADGEYLGTLHPEFLQQTLLCLVYVQFYQSSILYKKSGLSF